MRFLDYNGNGGLDPQDIATSLSVEEAGEQKDERHETHIGNGSFETNPGCAAMTALAMAITITLIILSAL